MFLLWHLSLTAINLSYTFPTLETSATALCGTTGIYIYSIYTYDSYDIWLNRWMELAAAASCFLWLMTRDSGVSSGNSPNLWSNALPGDETVGALFQAAWIPPAVPPASSGPEFVLRAFEVSLEDMFCMRHGLANQVQWCNVKCWAGIHSITKLQSSKEVNASAQKPWMREIMRCSLSFPGYADFWCIVQSCLLWGSYVWTNGYVWGRWWANSSMSEMEYA